MTVKRLFGFAAKIIVSVTVLAFLGLHSLNFFQFTFPPEQWYYSYLGFGLTSGGVILYLVMFMTESDTVLKRFIAITMLAVSLIGELATAGFGLQIEAWKNSGLALTEKDFSSMVIAVQLLGFAHAAALIAYYAGDVIASAFADKNKNGVPDWMERKNKSQHNQPQQNRPQQPATQVYNSDTDTAKLAQDGQGKAQHDKGGDNTHRPTNGQ